MSEKPQSRGVSVWTLIFVILFVLKLIGAAPNLSWWWVFAPLWGPIVFMVLVFFLFVVCYAAKDAFKLLKEKLSRVG